MRPIFMVFGELRLVWKRAYLFVCLVGLLGCEEKLVLNMELELMMAFDRELVGPPDFQPIRLCATQNKDTVHCTEQFDLDLESGQWRALFTFQATFPSFVLNNPHQVVVLSDWKLEAKKVWRGGTSGEQTLETIEFWENSDHLMLDRLIESNLEVTSAPQNVKNTFVLSKPFQMDRVSVLTSDSLRLAKLEALSKVCKETFYFGIDRDWCTSNLDRNPDLVSTCNLTNQGRSDRFVRRCIEKFESSGRRQ